MTIEIGSTLRTLREMRHLPNGSHVTCNADGIEYVKEAEAFYSVSGRDLVEAVHMGDVTVLTLGTGTFEGETIHQFKQRLRTVCVGSARLNGITMGPVYEALEALDINTPGLCPDMWVHPHDQDLINALPAGTLLLSGRHSCWQEQCLVVTTDEHVLVRALGGRTNYGLLRVLAYPEGANVHEWPTEPEGFDHRQAIEDLIRKAWTTGTAARDTNGWCGAYYTSMSRVWIDQSALLTDPAVGEPAAYAQMVDAPIGARVASTINSDNWWEKVEPNRWSLRGLSDGVETASFASGAYRWLRLEGEDQPAVPDQNVPTLGQRVIARAIADAPVGATFIYGSTSTSMIAYTKTEADLWLRTSGIPDSGTRFATTQVQMRVDDAVQGRAYIWTAWPGAPMPTRGSIIFAGMVPMMPVGSVFREVRDDGAWAMYQQVGTDAGDRAYGTVIIASSGPGFSHRFAHKSVQVEVLHVGIGAEYEPLVIPVLSHEQMDAMPAGTVVYDEEADLTWTKRDDGLWWQGGVRGGGSDVFEIKDGDIFRYTHIPVPTNLPF